MIFIVISKQIKSLLTFYNIQILQTHYYNSQLIAIMTPQPPERISNILLKSFAPGSLLFIPCGSYVRFHEDIL